MENFANRSIAALDLLRRTLREEAIDIVSVASVDEGPAIDLNQSLSPGTMVTLPPAPTITVALVVNMPVDHLDQVEKNKRDFIDIVQRDPFQFMPKGWYLPSSE